MDYSKCLSSLFTTLFVISLVFGIANGFGGVIRVHRRFVGNHHHLEELKQHDAHRHARFLRSTELIDVPMGSVPFPSLYYTHLAIGTPPKNYTVHIDTGSDVPWIYCQDCIGCPMDNDALGIHLTPYNPKTSKTAKIVAGGESYCQDLGPDLNDGPCPFQEKFGDQSKVSGYYVRDFLTYNKVSGGHKSQPTKEKITFGCARRYRLNEFQAKKATKLGIEGLIGFGSDNRSMISQLASSGIVRREFAHCLDPAKGGGIFAIGHVVKPEVTKMIPFYPNKIYSYLVKMQSVDVGGKVANIEDLGVVRQYQLALFDSGASECGLPEGVHNFVVKEVSSKSNLTVSEINDDFTCFNHSGSLDMTAFPPVNFNLGGPASTEATLTVHPRDYLFKQGNHKWCLAFLRGPPFLILGDVALSNRLVIYDIENRKIGWTEYDCSSSIEVEDGNGGVCAVGAHSESSPTSSN